MRAAPGGVEGEGAEAAEAVGEWVWWSAALRGCWEALSELLRGQPESR